MERRNAPTTIIVGILVLFVAGCLAAGCLKKPEGPGADLLYRDGTTLIKKQGTGEWAPLTDTAAIGLGDEIMTKEGGTIELEFPVNTFVKIGGNTHVKINDVGTDEANGRTTGRIELVFGKIRSVVTPFTNGESSFIIEMENGYVVARGTDFGFIRGPDGTVTKVLCLDGSVTVESLEEKAQGQKPAVLEAGRVIDLVAGEAPTRPAQIDEGLRREFLKEMDFKAEKARESVREDLRYDGADAPSTK
jgi:hypothetical protein